MPPMAGKARYSSDGLRCQRRGDKLPSHHIAVQSTTTISSGFRVVVGHARRA